MRKIIILATISLLLFSCKKKAFHIQFVPLQSNTIIATINDTAYTFNKSVTISDGPVPGAEQLQITAFDFASNNINIGILATDSIKARTYTDVGDLVSYAQFSFKKENDTTNYLAANVVSNPFVISITAITDSTIQGTFRGEIYPEGDSTQLPIVVAKGQFNVSR